VIINLHQLKTTIGQLLQQTSVQKVPDGMVRVVDIRAAPSVLDRQDSVDATGPGAELDHCQVVPASLI
jgi:hypothetical protein